MHISPPRYYSDSYYDDGSIDYYYHQYYGYPDYYNYNYNMWK